jgi:hypothetical protein
MPRPQSVDIFRVARQCGVTLVDPGDYRSSGRWPGLCSCKPTVKAIGTANGEAHLALCFRLVMETGNGLELHAATLQAISAVILSGQVAVDSALFDAFDQIDLGRLRRSVKALQAPTADVMAGALLALLAGPGMAARAA